MKRILTVLLATLALGAPALAANKPQAAFKPAQLPAMASTETDLGALAAPAAAMAEPKVLPPAMAPQALIDSLSAIKGSRDGTQTDVGVAPRVKRMLMGKQSGMIGGDGGNKNKGQLSQIGNTGEFPYTAMGVIASGCTGTVVMKRFVLTAAWCVYDLKTKKFFDNLDFYPAMNGKKTPFGKVAWKNVWVAKGFAEKGDLGFGYGLVELGEDIGDKTGWLGFGDAPNARQLNLTGYPFAVVPPQTMWETKCPVQGVDDNSVFYQCPGEPKSLAAMLGSPVWFKGKGDNDWQITGVHVTAQNEKMQGWWAARMSKAATETIISWATAADQTDQGTGDQTNDQGTGDQTNDQGTGGTDTPQCTCDQQSQPQ